MWKINGVKARFKKIRELLSYDMHFNVYRKSGKFIKTYRSDELQTMKMLVQMGYIVELITN